MPTIPGEALTLKALSALLETMGHSDAMQRQRHFVKAAKVSEATQGFGLGILLTLGGAGLATYGVYALMEGWRAPMRVMSVVLGGFGFLIGLVMLPASVACLRAASKVLFARKPEEAFRGAVEPALKSFRQFANSWISIVEFAAFPVSETYRESSEAAIALAQRWRDLRESLAADADSLRIGSIQTAPHPMLGDRVSELRLEVVYPGGTTWLRNAAVEVEGQWFLATLEPIMEPGANAASQPAPSPGTLKT